MTPYLDKPEQWAALVEHARRTKLMGLDSETFGHDVRKASPAYRAKVHVWSIAFQTGEKDTRGYHRARGAVLPAAALEHQGVRAVLEDPTILKIAHNVHHDQHSLENHGIKLVGIRDTLALVRLAYPDRALEVTKGFRLKPLARDLLGKPKRDEYDDIVKDVVLESRWVDKATCVCGDEKCRKRVEPYHAKVRELEEKVTSKNVVYALEDIVPGHKQWERLMEYAGADAVDALELDDLAMRRLAWLETKLPPVPW